MFKALILFFVASSLSYAEKLELNAVKELKIDTPIHNSAHEEITPLEYFGFMIYGGSFVMLSKSKDLIDNSYARMKLEKPTFHYKMPHIMRKCSFFGIGIGTLIMFSRDIVTYLKR